MGAENPGVLLPAAVDQSICDPPPPPPPPPVVCARCVCGRLMFIPLPMPMPIPPVDMLAGVIGVNDNEPSPASGVAAAVGVLQLNAGVSTFRGGCCCCCCCGVGVPQPFPRAGLLGFFPKTRDSKSASGSEAGLLEAPGIPPNDRNSPAGLEVVLTPSSWSLRVCSCSIF